MPIFFSIVCTGNRRLDEWVPLSRFESLEKCCIDTYHNGLHSASGLDFVEGGDRKITRNQKRKHDAINHVQTVCLLLWLGSVLWVNQPGQLSLPFLRVRQAWRPLNSRPKLRMAVSHRSGPVGLRLPCIQPIVCVCDSSMLEMISWLHDSTLYKFTFSLNCYL